jgi:hypothetical protein
MPVKHYSKLIENFFLSEDLRAKHREKNTTSGIILSCTTFPAKIKYFEYTLFSVLRQTIRPEKIFLWLSEDEFPAKEASIPESLKRFFDYGFEIRFVKGKMRSYHKLVHAIREFPGHAIVTFDDDVYYRPDWLETLYKTYLEHPKDIAAHRAHRVVFKNGYIVPYSNWPPGTDRASYLNFPTGVGGNLYPPRSLFKDACNPDLFLRLSPAADDIWFYVMALLQKTKIRRVQNGSNKAFDFDYILDDEYKAIPRLADINVKNSQNDVQLKNILEHYNLYDSFYRIYGQEK